MQGDVIEVFRHVCTEPGMYLQSKRYEAVCAYINGYNTALQGAPLLGFREWLLTRSSEWTNLPWWSLVRRSNTPGADLSQPLSDDESDALVVSLLRTLEGFWSARQRRGIDVIFYEYCEWLLGQRDEATLLLRERLKATL